MSSTDRATALPCGCSFLFRTIDVSDGGTSTPTPCQAILYTACDLHAPIHHVMIRELIDQVSSKNTTGLS